MSINKISTSYIYIILLREFLEKKDIKEFNNDSLNNIYKIGRTSQENYKRFNNYSRGSVVLFHRICFDSLPIEREIINVFKKKFKHCKDYGNEYFQGNLRDMIITINRILDGEDWIWTEETRAIADYEFGFTTTVPP